MTRRTATNVPASVFARLKTIALQRGIDVQLVLTRYFIERLLYRLARSKEHDNFILKGAMLFMVWTGNLYRPSRDVDFLGRGPDDVDSMVTRIGAICQTPADVDDGVVFDVDGIKGERIRDAQEYHGIRVHVIARLGQVTTRVQIDIGIGDPAPGAHDADYPTLLDLPAPNVLMYSREAVVAEKFEAIVSLGAGNSRMKDFSDLFVLQRDFSFEGAALSHAVAATFARRKTGVPDEIPVGLSTEWAGAATQEKMWRAFLRRSNLEPPTRSFADVVDRLQDFLLPTARAAADRAAFEPNWPANGPRWV